ncbi:MAG: hypothetical protein RLZZ618_851 [Pseudomonadota bacterium]|jgi:benzil reductase ((S)-benzoin forming)
MRLVIISGGSAGLGLALCRFHEAHGDRVVDFSRSAPHAFSVKVDLSDPVGAVEAVQRTLGTLAAGSWSEILIVNNAGTLDPIGPASTKPSAEVLANMNINFSSPILWMSAAIAAFQQHDCRKRLANITSGAATSAYAGWSLYGAAKAGLEAYIRSVAREQQAQPFPIEVVNINPGVMDTAMQATIRATDATDFPDTQRFVERQARGELQPPERIAQAIARIMALPHWTAGQLYSAADHLS